MNNDQKIQMADVSAICLPSAICRKSEQNRPFLVDKQTKNSSNENDCYLPSGIIFCQLDSIESNNSNKNNKLQDDSRWQGIDSVDVLPSGAKPVTTRAAALFTECCADPLYLRYIQITHASAVYLYDRVKGTFSYGRGGVSQ